MYYQANAIERGRGSRDASEAYTADPKNAWRRPFDIVRRFGNEIGQAALVDAEAVFRLLLRDYPGRTRTHEVLGSVAEDLGRTDEARDLYREALRRLDDDTTVSRPLGYALREWLEGRLAEL